MRIFLLSLGLPAVSIGAGGQGGGAHTAAEWFSPEGRELGLRRILLALCLLLGEASVPEGDVCSGGGLVCRARELVYYNWDVGAEVCAASRTKRKDL